MKVKDDRQAVRAMAGYARLLYYHGPELYSEDAMKCYRKTSVIGEKAAFSPHAVSKEERKDTRSVRAEDEKRTEKSQKLVWKLDHEIYRKAVLRRK